MGVRASAYGFVRGGTNMQNITGSHAFLVLSFLDSLVPQACVSAESGLLCAGEAPGGTRGDSPSESAGGGPGGPVSPAGAESRAAGPGRPWVLLSTASCGAFSHLCEPGLTTRLFSVRCMQRSAHVSSSVILTNSTRLCARGCLV